MALQVIEGTWEEIKRHEAELVGQRFRLIPLFETEILRKPPAPTNKPATAAKPSHRVSAMGKYAGVLSTEDFIRRKQEEIDLEERPAVATPVEVYSDERIAEFLLSSAVDASDYEAARVEVRTMGIDPDSIRENA